MPVAIHNPNPLDSIQPMNYFGTGDTHIGWFIVMGSRMPLAATGMLEECGDNGIRPGGQHSLLKSDSDQFINQADLIV